MADLAIDQLVSLVGAGEVGRFEACAKYFDGIDVLVYLEEDVAYRADRVDAFLTLLWHPSKTEAIGVKLKGFRFLFDRMRAMLKPAGVEDSEFPSLVLALEVAMTAGLGAAITADVEHQRIEEKYAEARRLLAQKRFDAKQMTDAVVPQFEIDNHA